jgi:hypothetical protein
MLGINSDWLFSPHDEWLSTDVKKMETWQQKALFISTKTDAIIIKMFAAKKTATVCVGGKSIENVNVTQLLACIKEHIYRSTILKEVQGHPTIHAQKNGTNSHLSN